jgi:UDP-N-acetylmuramyl pentapeptide phosphotransferase/UDP-N-acetylglucosamine-1-phosphate transferase
MTFAQRKVLVLAAWVATVATVGLILAIDKPDLWLLIACFALIPATIGNWFWNAPEATLTQLIARARSRS